MTDELFPEVNITVPIDDNEINVHITQITGPDMTPANPTDAYSVSDIDKESTENYYGFLSATGAWYIMREEPSTKTYRYAGGASNYAAGWTGRTALTYGLFSDIF